MSSMMTVAGLLWTVLFVPPTDTAPSDARPADKDKDKDKEVDPYCSPYIQEVARYKRYGDVLEGRRPRPGRYCPIKPEPGPAFEPDPGPSPPFLMPPSFRLGGGGFAEPGKRGRRGGQFSALIGPLWVFHGMPAARDLSVGLATRVGYDLRVPSPRGSAGRAPMSHLSMAELELSLGDSYFVLGGTAFVGGGPGIEDGELLRTLRVGGGVTAMLKLLNLEVFHDFDWVGEGPTPRTRGRLGGAFRLDMSILFMLLSSFPE